MHFKMFVKAFLLILTMSTGTHKQEATFRHFDLLLQYGYRCYTMNCYNLPSRLTEDVRMYNSLHMTYVNRRRLKKESKQVKSSGVFFPRRAIHYLLIFFIFCAFTHLQCKYIFIIRLILNLTAKIKDHIFSTRFIFRQEHFAFVGCFQMIQLTINGCCFGFQGD